MIVNLTTTQRNAGGWRQLFESRRLYTLISIMPTVAVDKADLYDRLGRHYSMI